MGAPTSVLGKALGHVTFATHTALLQLVCCKQFGCAVSFVSHVLYCKLEAQDLVALEPGRCAMSMLVIVPPTVKSKGLEKADRRL